MKPYVGEFISLGVWGIIICLLLLFPSWLEIWCIIGFLWLTPSILLALNVGEDGIE